MKRILLLVFCNLAIISCGVSGKVGADRSSEQPSSNNSSQQVKTSRGTKIETEECEELAMDYNAKNPREFGQGESVKESFATNIALLDARSKMAQRIQSYVSGLIIKTESQTEATLSYDAKTGQLQTSKWEQAVSQCRIIKKNAYVKDDGSFNVYVCIEMPASQLSDIYSDLVKEKVISETITEQLFMEGLRTLQIQQ